MSILSMPTFSSAPISYCVMMDSSPSAAAPAPLVGAVQTGTYSASGPGAITTPAACTDMWREIPSIRELRSSSRSIGRVARHQVPQLVHLLAPPRGS